MMDPISNIKVTEKKKKVCNFFFKYSFWACVQSNKVLKVERPVFLPVAAAAEAMNFQILKNLKNSSKKKITN